MERFAIIIDGVVWTICEWDQKDQPDWTPPEGSTLVPNPPEHVSAGWGYDGEWRAPAPPTEDSLTKLRGFLADNPDVLSGLRVL